MTSEAARGRDRPAAERASALEVKISSYRPEDAARTLQIFRDAVSVTASAHYTPRQVTAWLGRWGRDLRPERLQMTRATGNGHPVAQAHAAGAGPALLSEWDAAMRGRDSFVAVAQTELGAQVVGFSDVRADGYIDMLFVAPAFGGRGVATALLKHAESVGRGVGAQRLWANVSITARPVFEARGFKVVAVQHPVVDGVQLTNHRMERML